MSVRTRSIGMPASIVLIASSTGLKDYEATLLQVIREHSPRQELVLGD
jgi:hypothetical protein